MNDRFKFRVWDKKYSQWIEPIEINNFGTLSGLGQNNKRYDDFVIQQCTALKDKNGDLIFEGDWIEVEICFGELSHLSIRECKFKDGKFGYELDSQMMDLLNGESTIKGNIFEGVKDERY